MFRSMKTLFPIPEVRNPDIPGLVYRPEYVSVDEEAALVEAIDAESWDTTWERRRQSYGGGYGRKQAASRPMPSWGRALGDRIYRDGLADRPFDHMLVNEYHPGQGIALHRDYEPFDRMVVSLSLLAPCVVDFRRIEDGRRESMLLERRSLLILSDDARYAWQHGIARRKTDRWAGLVILRARRLSVTFRSRKSA